VRMGDRVRFDRALDQLAVSLKAASDLDEARGQALTFLSMVTAAMLESGGDRSLHRETLEAARELDTLQSSLDVAEAVRRRSEIVAAPRFGEFGGPSAHLVDRALNLVDRNFAKDLTDASVAQQLGLSTSHFRFLFKQATGQPFHKYLVSLRLEKARRMLVEQGLPVGTVAKAVGFSALSHFSRAFAQRFSVSPTSLRRGGETS
ncbi:AraC family transcriptional regulator, partial [bacterium]